MITIREKTGKNTGKTTDFFNIVKADKASSIYFVCGNADFIKFSFTQLGMMGYDKAYSMVYLMLKLKKDIEEIIREEGHTDGYEYEVSFGMENAASGVGDIIYFEGILGKKQLTGWEFDTPTFIQAGATMEDVKKAHIFFMENREERGKAA